MKKATICGAMAMLCATTAVPEPATAQVAMVDCAAPAGSIEHAACTDERVTAIANLQQGLLAVLWEALPRDAAQKVAEREASWIAGRNQTCAALADARLAACLRRAFGRRALALKDTARAHAGPDLYAAVADEAHAGRPHWAFVAFLAGQDLAGEAGRRATEFLVAAAAHGQAMALNNVAAVLDKAGRGTAALEMWQAGARNASAEAWNSLGLLHATGRLVARDLGKARDAFEEAIGLGLDAAATNLGRMAYNGEGMAKDRRRARALFQAAADGGDAGGRYHLGLMLLTGEGGAANCKRGKALIAAAARQGYGPARERLATGLSCDP